MIHEPLIISLPIADRPRSFAFYQDALGLAPIGEPAALPWGYSATFADPDGHLWMVAQSGHAEG